MSKDSCYADSCDRPVHAKKLCPKHYKRLRTYGDPNAPLLDRSIEARLEALSEDMGDCRVWTGSKYPSGYGEVRYEGRVQGAHRVAWEVANGPIGDGLLVDHVCHNRACIKVEHLRLADRFQNASNRRGESRRKSDGVRNVYPAYGGKWTVHVRKNGKVRTFGTHDTLEEAAAVAKAAREQLFGDFAGKGGDGT